MERCRNVKLGGTAPQAVEALPRIVMIDRLEDRRLSSADAIAAVQSPEPIPHVVGVFVSSTRWTDAFKQHIARPAGAGGDAAGVGVGLSFYGPEVGWTNLDEII